MIDKAIVLAAGKGTRLRPLTYGIPKPLLPVKGRPVIDWVLRNITSYNGIKEIFIAIPGATSDEFHDRVLVNAHGICMDSYFRNVNSNVKITTIPTFQRDTGGDVRHVLEEIDLKTGSILVAFGDNITTFDLNQFVHYHERCKEKNNIAATVLLFEVPQEEVHRFGIAKLKEENGITFIEDFIEKPKTEEAPSRYANAGYYILELDKIFDMLPRERLKIESTIFPKLAKEGKLAGFKAKLPFWLDIGTIEAYEAANKLMHDNLIIPPPLPEDKNG